MNLIIIASLLVASTAPSSSVTTTPVDQIIDTVIDSYGLAGLSDVQQIAARNLVKATLLERASDSTLTQSASKYFAQRGYKPVDARIIDENGTSYLVVKIGSLRYATSDVPVSFPAILMTPGSYFCKTNFSGGVTELIDQDGNSQNFTFARWVALR